VTVFLDTVCSVTLLHWCPEIPADPSGEHPRHIGAIGLPGEEVIGVIERDEALWMLGGVEYTPSVVDIDKLISRSMEDEECPMQHLDSMGEVLSAHVLEKLATNRKWSTSYLDGNLTRALKGRDGVVGKEVDQLGRVEGRPNRDHGDSFGELRGGSQDGGPSQTVANNDFGGLVVIAQQVGRSQQVIDVGREVGVSEVAVAGPEPGEVKA
jgi:hypothetical protein